jgi:RimJ/RimL family protein N-acetyltransferase
MLLGDVVRLIDELDERTAEFAILVCSRLKGRGLGWLLMQRIIDYANEKGLRRVYGDVLAENTTMLKMCAELGFRSQDIGSDIRRVCSISKNSGKPKWRQAVNSSSAWQIGNLKAPKPTDLQSNVRQNS